MNEEKSAAVADLATRLGRNETLSDGDVAILEAKLPSPVLAALLKLGDTCGSIDRYVNQLILRVTALERQVDILKSFARAEPTACPIRDRGMTYFPQGDPIPSHSQVDLLDGNIYLFKDKGTVTPLAFVKNNSGRPLKRGEPYAKGAVDSQLRRDEVPVNDFFLLEP